MRAPIAYIWRIPVTMLLYRKTADSAPRVHVENDAYRASTEIDLSYSLLGMHRL